MLLQCSVYSLWNSWGVTHKLLVFRNLKLRGLEQENINVVYLFWLKIRTKLKKMRLFIDSWYFHVLQWHIFRLLEPECKHYKGWQGEPMVWGLRGEGVVFQGWIGNVDSVRALSYSSLPPQRGVFPATHSCCCCCAALVLLRHSSESRNPLLSGFVCCFCQCH